MSGRQSSRREAEVAVVRPAQPRTTSQAVAGATERRLIGALEVPLEQVLPDPTQPRRDWAHDDGERRLAELAASVEEFGVIQPLLVREEGTLADGRQRYVIIAGGRRREAAERAGLASLPVLVRGEEALRVRVLQLVENLQRQGLSPLDEARAYQELIDLEGFSPPALAARLHLSAQHVRDRLRVLADQVLADAVERRQISATAAREITKLPDDEVLTFRGRVLAGERLQTNDVAAVRARLAASGIVNPRRKVARSGAGNDSGAGRTPAAPDPPAPPERAETALPPALLVAADHLVDALGASLRGARRDEVVTVLRELRSSPALAAWWLLVDARLRERLEGAGKDPLTTTGPTTGSPPTPGRPASPPRS